MQYGHEALALSAFAALRQFARANLEPFFIEQLKHPYEKLRQAIVKSLAYKYFYQIDYTKDLIEVLQTDPSYLVQKEAADILGKIATQEAVEAAIHWNENFRRDDDTSL